MKSLPKSLLRAARGFEADPQEGGAAGASREELLRIWDGLSDEGRQIVMFIARMTAREEGSPEGDGTVGDLTAPRLG
jgi:hypothetical protein